MSEVGPKVDLCTLIADRLWGIKEGFSSGGAIASSQFGMGMWVRPSFIGSH